MVSASALFFFEIQHNLPEHKQNPKLRLYLSLVYSPNFSLKCFPLLPTISEIWTDHFGSADFLSPEVPQQRSRGWWSWPGRTIITDFLFENGSVSSSSFLPWICNRCIQNRWKEAWHFWFRVLVPRSVLQVVVWTNLWCRHFVIINLVINNLRWMLMFHRGSGGLDVSKRCLVSVQRKERDESCQLLHEPLKGTLQLLNQINLKQQRDWVITLQQCLLHLRLQLLSHILLLLP